MVWMRKIGLRTSELILKKVRLLARREKMAW